MYENSKLIFGYFVLFKAKEFHFKKKFFLTFSFQLKFDKFNTFPLVCRTPSIAVDL